MTIEEIQNTTEFQTFDRKSARIDAKGLATAMIALANADGGIIALGVEDDGTITGTDGNQEHVNDLLRVPFDYCVPSLSVRPEYLEVTDITGQVNHVILLHVAQSEKVHANQADEVYYRVGDKSKKLNFEQRMQLVYAKGEHYYEDAPVHNAKPEDIDMHLVETYCELIGYGKGAQKYLRENGYIFQQEDFRGNMREVVSVAAVLLFGKNPQYFFQRARVRVIKYEGTEEKVGREMNVIKDVIFEGSILELANKTIDFVGTQIKEHTYLGADGRFTTDPQYPEFCWKELIVNAICHRDYSILGTDIQVKIFDNHITVESPGIFPGLVRPNNIREIHFSRNPKIAAALRANKLVKEFGEGVDRIYRELEDGGFPEPSFTQVAFMIKASIWERKVTEVAQSRPKSDQRVTKEWPNIWSETKRLIAYEIAKDSNITIEKLVSLLGKGQTTIKKYIKELQTEGYLKRIGSKFSGHWEIIEKP